MAKQAVGPIGRHVEKAVLALCGLALLYVVAMYGVVSPNKVGPEGSAVGPVQIDQDVKVAAESLRNRIINANVDTAIEVKDFVNTLGLVSDPLAFADVEPALPRPVPFNLPVPDVLGAIRPDEKRRLVEVVGMGPPMTLNGRSGVYLSPPDLFSASSTASKDNVFLQDANWVTVYARFDRQAQERRCVEAGYDRNRVETLFLGMDLQRRMLKADGSYTEWSDVAVAATRARPVFPKPTVYEADRGHNVSDADRAVVENFIEMISEDANQLELMRPLFPPIEYPDNWLYPRGDAFDILDMDAEYQEEPSCRYPECQAGTGGEQTQSMSPRELLRAAREALDEGNYDRAETLATAVTNRNTVSSSDRTDAEDLIGEIAAARAAAVAAGAARRNPAQVLWVHDAGDEVRSGRTYQYRCRTLIYNRYCGTPTLLEDPKNAEVIALTGPWSDPTDPVTIPPDTLVFVRGARERNEEVKVEVLKKVAGAWVKKALNVGVGQPIFDEARVWTPADNSDKSLVRFDPGARVVDIDFRRPVRGRDRNGRLERLAETTALIFVDESGELHERLESFDKQDPAYGSIRTYKPPRL